MIQCSRHGYRRRHVSSPGKTLITVTLFMVSCFDKQAIVTANNMHCQSQRESLLFCSSIITNAPHIVTSAVAEKQKGKLQFFYHNLFSHTASTIPKIRGGTTAKKERAATISSSKIATATTARKWKQRMTLVLVFMALFNDMLQITMILPILPTLVSSDPPLGVSANKEIAMGIFFASKDIFQLITAPIAGILTAKASSNFALILSTIALGVATFVFAEASTFVELLVARSLQGMASAATLCGGLSLIAETFDAEHNRGSAMGIAYSGLALGLLCGPLIGGLLFDRLDGNRIVTFRLASMVVFANAIAQLILMLFGGINNGEKSVAREKIAKKTNSSNASIKSFRKFLGNRDIMLVTLANMAIHATLGVIKPLSQIVLERDYQMKTLQRSFVITIATVTYFIGTPLAGWYSDNMKHPRSYLLSISLGLMAISTIFFALRTVFGLISFYISVALLGISLSLNGSVGQALLADIVDRNKNELSTISNKGTSSNAQYSIAFALSDMADSLGLIIGPILGLTIAQIFGPSIGAGCLGLICMFLSPIVLNIP